MHGTVLLRGDICVMCAFRYSPYLVSLSLSLTAVPARFVRVSSVLCDRKPVVYASVILALNARSHKTGRDVCNPRVTVSATFRSRQRGPSFFHG